MNCQNPICGVPLPANPPRRGPRGPKIKYCDAECARQGGIFLKARKLLLTVGVDLAAKICAELIKR